VTKIERILIDCLLIALTVSVIVAIGAVIGWYVGGQ
jgi:hypothetical protein